MVLLATKQNLFNDSVQKANMATLGDDKGFINPLAKASIITRGTGTVSMVSGIYAQLKCDRASGVVTEVALHSTVNAVQRELSISDLIINRHKLNSQLYEFTNLKSNLGTIMGNLMVESTILVKTWEPNLGQYVLIRRPARFPVFSHLLDAYEIDERLKLDLEEVFGEDITSFKTQINDLEEKIEDLEKEEQKEDLEEWWDDTKENVKEWWEGTKDFVSNTWDDVTNFFTQKESTEESTEEQQK